MRVLLVNPPMTDLHGAYPSTAYLTGFLKTQNVEVSQYDASINLFLRLFSVEGLERIHTVVQNSPKKKDSVVLQHFLAKYDHYLKLIDPVTRFLQGKDPSLALRLANRSSYPESPRSQETWAYENAVAYGALKQLIGVEAFEKLKESGELYIKDPLSMAFGQLGVTDRARYIATKYLEDLVEVVQVAIDSNFEVSKYGETLSESASSFKPLLKRLNESNLVDEVLSEVTLELIEKEKPDVVGFSVPFPGSLYGALRMSKVIKEKFPKIKILLGGGYVNTELREMSEPTVFDFIDYMVFDDGEKPIVCLLEHLQGKRSIDELLRTRLRVDNKVVEKTSNEKDFPHGMIGTPTYKGLDLDQYLAVLENLSPFQRTLTSGRWNKLTVAHGCYWKKCTFCDVHLDYIGRYEPTSADVIVDRMEALMAETGRSGFHFVDEAAPPALLGKIAEKILERGLNVTWWGNVRFEKAFTPELTKLLAKSGCVAISGGLEIGSDRLLKLIKKGTSLEQVVKVTEAFSSAGIFVHAYLIYGYPSQTAEETMNSLEFVRQLFQQKLIHSGVWHRFMVTPFSPIGKEPEKYGIRIKNNHKVSFAKYNLLFSEKNGVDFDRFGEPLRRALHHFIHSSGLDREVNEWFQGEKVRKPTIERDFVSKILAQR